MLDEALQIALRVGAIEDACRAYVNQVWTLLDWFRLDEAEQYLRPGLKLAEEAEFLGFLSYMRVEQARLALSRGRWDDAVRYAGLIVDTQRPSLTAAAAVLARVAVRRGQNHAGDLLGRAWDLAAGIGELQRTSPGGTARDEDTWPRGDDQAARDVVRPVYEQAVQDHSLSYQPELAYWLTAAGEPVPVAGEHPYALLAAGRWRGGPAVWQAAGAPYEQALALTHSPETPDLLTALAIADKLGARPLAGRIRARLRALGVTRIPRG